MFDLNRPLIASSGFTAGDEQIAAGAVFDWRARGISEVDVYAMFRSGLLYHESELQPAKAALAVTPSERVVVETPAQDRKRRDRR